MITKSLMRAASLFTNNFALAGIVGIVFVGLVMDDGRLFDPKGTVVAQAQRDLDELVAMDPLAAKVVQQVKDDRAMQGLLIAAHSAGADDRRRAVMKRMSDEMTQSEALPYRARLAALALSDRDLSDPEKRDAFLDVYASACEMLELGAAKGETAEFMTLLEQARQDPTIWPIVRDDPLALVLWSEDVDPDGLRFYQRSRDWLGEPLTSVDWSDQGEGLSIRESLQRLMRNEQSVRLAIEKGQLGVYGLAVMLTHGRLVELCRAQYGIDPVETISVVVMNEDMLGKVEGDDRWIAEKAAWLATIHTQHQTVWLAAGVSEYALRLHGDAPHVSDSLLTKYGADDAASLIYDKLGLTKQDEVAAAAQAIDVFGDMAIYVFTRYSKTPEFLEPLRRHLVDPEIGIRVIPFVIRYQDEAFGRIEDSKDWVDRYFDRDGSRRGDSLDWIQHIPGGAPIHVARQWARGYPCEWSEVGWAAVDMVDLALIVATAGGSEVAIASAKTTMRGARASKSGLRAAKKAEWMKHVNRAPRSRGASRLADVARSVSQLTEKGRLLIRGTIRLPVEGVRAVKQSARKGLDAWKSLSPAKRKGILRGVLGATLFVSITERSLPNAQKIGDGIGRLFGDAAVGAVTLAGAALSAATRALVDVATSRLTSTSRVVLLAFLCVLAMYLIYREFRLRPSVVIAGK